MNKFRALTNSRDAILDILRQQRAYAHEVHGAMVRRGIAISITRVYQHLRRLEEDGLAVSERVRTGRACNRRRYYQAVHP